MRCCVGGVVLALIILVASCVGVSEPDVDVNFGAEIQLQQNLMFTFATDMVPDSLVNEWDTTTFVRFTPAVRGRFKWLSTRQLVFSPGTGFAPGTQYAAELNDAIVRNAPNPVAMPTSRAFAFHTPWQSIARSHAQWTRNAATAAIEARILLECTYPVSIAEVGPRLAVRRNGANIPFSVEQAATGGGCVVILAADKLDAMDASAVTLTIAKGLPMMEGGPATTTELSTVVSLPLRTSMSVSAIEPQWDGTSGTIEIATSQAIDPSTVTGGVVVEPNVVTSVDVTPTGLAIRGMFQPGTDYTVRLTQSLRGLLGGTLEEEVRTSIQFSPLEPAVVFTTSKAMYLSARGSRLLGIKLVNVPHVKVTVFRIYENNIQHFLREARRYSWDDGEGNAGYNFGWMEMEHFGDTVHTREMASKDLGATAGGVALLNFDVQQHVRHKGMYVVRVESMDRQWIQQSRIVAVSDVGLIVKQGLNDLTVFANSIADVSPMQGVEIGIHSTNNQLIETVVTGSDGIVRLDDLKERLGTFSIGMITARYGEDFTFLLPRDTRVDQSRFETGGMVEHASGLQAYLYGDRSIYRPGETMHIATIVRDRQWKPIADQPVRLRIVQPNGTEYRSLKSNLDAQGSATIDVTLPEAALTGRWLAEVYGVGSALLASYDIAVEEFLPDRLRVSQVVSTDVLQPGMPYSVGISASYFFGPPASGRSYELQSVLASERFQPKQHPGFTFDVKHTLGSIRRDVRRTGTLTQNGTANEQFIADSSLTNVGLLKATMFLAVFDETGRPVYRTETRPMRTQMAMFGLKASDRYVATNQPTAVPLVACNLDGSVTSAEAIVRLVKVDHHSIMERTGDGTYRWISQEREHVLTEERMMISGLQTRFTWKPHTSGEYQVRISPPGAQSYVAYTWYAYGWGDVQSSAFDVNTEGLIDITLDKDTYQPGEQATVLFKAPFSGKMLVTVERDGVLEHHVLTTNQRSASMTLSVKDSWTPNVYIAATLIKPHAGSDMPLTVAHGYQPLSVERPATKLPVSISATSSSRSGKRQTITVKTTPGAHVTIAVVDEGILQIRNQATPDPWKHFYRKRALQVESFDMYPYLYPELTMGRRSYGAGDDGSDYGMRLNPFKARRSDLLAAWSGIVRAANGTATLTVDLPSFAGEVRIMAVAWKDASFGKAEQPMTIADPLVVNASLPRVLAPGDTVRVPVMLANMTSKQSTLTATLLLEGPIDGVGTLERTVTVAPNSEAMAEFVLAARRSMGIAVVTATVKGGAETSRQRTECSVRPTTPLTEVSGSGSVVKGSHADMKVGDGFIPGAASARLLVSNFPAPHIMANLRDLLGYPHGCLEQTVSKAFPQLYYADLVKAWGGKNNGQTSDPVRNVQEAIRKVESMQTWSGGLSTWPGSSTTHEWTSAYAAHFLVEADRAGFDVQRKVLDKLLLFLERSVRKPELEDYSVRKPDGVYEIKRRPSRTIFYSLLVLAVAGRQDVATMNQYKNRKSDLGYDSRMLLACTYQLLGDSRSFTAIAPQTVGAAEDVPYGSESYASPIRDVGLALYALAIASPDDGRTGALAQRLGTMMQGRSTYTTQENAFAILALGRLARRAVRSGGKATISVNGKVVATTSGEPLGIDVAPGSIVRVKSEQGTMYYAWSAEGIKATDDGKREDRSLVVRRSFFTADGKPITALTFKQNDLVVIAVTMQTNDRSVIRDVVISDVLPAGLELENPRIGGRDGISWVKDPGTARYYDYRDDRMNLFVTAEPKPRTYYYSARAVTKGRFSLGPIGADAMYLPDVHSYHGGGTVRIF